MNVTRILTRIACAAIAAAGGATGWALRGPPSPPAAEVHRATAPLIAVSRDGNVTLHVEGQPLQWVLGQIALQGGTDASISGAAAARTICADAPPQHGCSKIDHRNDANASMD